MASKKEFGERNMNLSFKLLDEKQYLDWVVTTAFYSSIHFVEDFILPKKINGLECKNISDVKSAYNLNGRHSARLKLVYDSLGVSIGAKYQWLDDNSRNSRYTTYKISTAQASKAKQYLEEIYNICYKTT